MNNNYKQIVPLQSGYYLEDEVGFLSVIMPEQRTNYVPNPVLELSPGSASTMIRIFSFAIGGITRIEGGPFWRDYPRYSVSSGNFLVTTLGSTTLSGVFAASVWAKAVTPESEFHITVSGLDAITNLTVTYNSPTFTAKNLDFEQYTHVFDFAKLGSPSGVYNMVMAINFTSTSVVDIVGLQLERGNYPTSFIHGYGGEGFMWDEIPFNGPSTRTTDAICGGRKINLKQLGFRITSVDGLGIPDNFDLNSQARAFGLGSIFTSRSIKDREISFSGILYSKNLDALLKQRNEIGHAVFEIDKMRCFEWEPVTCTSETPCVTFNGILSSGLQFTFNNNHGEEIELSFTATDVEITSCDMNCQELDVESTLVSNSLIPTDLSGNRLDIPPITLVTYSGIMIHDVAVSRYTGKIYAAISAIAGITTYYFIVEYNGIEWIPIAQSTTQFARLHTFSKYLFGGVWGASTFSGLNGYVGGYASSMLLIIDLELKTLHTNNVIPTTNVLDRAGVSGSPSVNAFTDDGYNFVYVGGNFDAAVGLSQDLVLINIREGLQFEDHGFGSLTTWVNGGILDLIYIRNRREIWMVGDFNVSYLSATYPEPQGVFGYSYTRASATNVLTGGIYQYPQLIVSNSPLVIEQGYVYTIELYKGRLVIGGKFNDFATGSVYYPNTAKTSGLAWIDNDGLARPFDGSWGVGGGSPEVFSLATCGNVLHVAGAFDSYGTVDQNVLGYVYSFVSSAIGAMILTSGSQAESSNPSLSVSARKAGVPNLDGVICANGIQGYAVIYFNGGIADTTEIFNVSEVVLCDNRLTTRPVIYIQGPGQLKSISNQANLSKTFLDYTFLPGPIVSGIQASSEILVFDFTESPTRVTSTLFGDLTDNLLPSSTPIALEPGENYITVTFAEGSTTAHTKAWLCYKETALSAEAIQMECPIYVSN